jgi:ubiquinone/menaquinone biosynthesis C-methylase UbiE
MDVDAKSYGELNKPQYDSSIEFIKEFIHFSEGDKVLDMGCGTGDITKYIADIVGSKGEVVGVDPDDERIKIGKENFKEVSNLHFHVGSALIGFPREGEAYYDVHITTHAFHWFPVDQKKLYIQKAYQSLKPGGSLAILCADKFGPERKDQHEIIDMHPVSADGLRELFQDVNLFTNVEVKQAVYTTFFESQEKYKSWIKASTHHNLEELDPVYVKAVVDKLVTFHDDGSVTSKMPSICVVTMKQ